MATFDRHYTLEEARAELPGLRERFARIHEILSTLKDARLELQRIEKLVRSNGHGSGHADFGAQIGEIQKLLAEVTEKGIEVKDMERGLVDFPHWRDGAEVYLCWLYGEDDIFYWHSIEGGFGGREPL